MAVQEVPFGGRDHAKPAGRILPRDVAQDSRGDIDRRTPQGDSNGRPSQRYFGRELAHGAFARETRGAGAFAQERWKRFKTSRPVAIGATAHEGVPYELETVGIA